MIYISWGGFFETLVGIGLIWFDTWSTIVLCVQHENCPTIVHLWAIYVYPCMLYIHISCNKSYQFLCIWFSWKKHISFSSLRRSFGEFLCKQGKSGSSQGRTDGDNGCRSHRMADGTMLITAERKRMALSSASQRTDSKGPFTLTNVIFGRYRFVEENREQRNRKFHPSCDGIWCPILKFEPRIFAVFRKTKAVPVTWFP